MRARNIGMGRGSDSAYGACEAPGFAYAAKLVQGVLNYSDRLCDVVFGMRERDEIHAAAPDEQAALGATGQEKPPHQALFFSVTGIEEAFTANWRQTVCF